MKYLICAAILALSACKSFDVVPTAVYDPASGQWHFNANVVPTLVEPTK